MCRYQILLSQLDDLRNLVREDISKIGRMTLSALIVIEVHARDVVANMVKEEVNNANAFEWISQLRSELNRFSLPLHFNVRLLLFLSFDGAVFDNDNI